MKSGRRVLQERQSLYSSTDRLRNTAPRRRVSSLQRSTEDRLLPRLIIYAKQMFIGTPFMTRALDAA